jgi:shikimate kinase
MKDNPKTVFVLIGAKGTGKSYIGRLIEKKLGIKFLSTEKIFITIRGAREVLDKSFLKEGYGLVEKEIDSYLKRYDKIMFESTGAFDFFEDLLRNLQSKYNVKLIFIYAPEELCRERIKRKDSAVHLKMPYELIKKIYKITNSLNYKYSLKIDNSKRNDKDVIESFKGIL